MKPASLGIITSADPQKQKVIVKMEPFGVESGWLPCLYRVSSDLAERSCMVIPCHGTYGQALVIPYPINVPIVTALTNAAPPQVSMGGVTVTCQTSVALVADNVGQNVLVVPTLAGFVISGVIQ